MNNLKQKQDFFASLDLKWTTLHKNEKFVDSLIFIEVIFNSFMAEDPII